LSPVTDAILEGTIDGQPVKSDASARLKFPASGGETGVNISLASSGGTISTSGTTPAPTTNTAANTTANSAASSSNSAAPANRPAQPIGGNTNAGGSSAASIKKPGTWGLFRFFNDGSPKKEATGEYILTYALGGKNVTATIEPSGGDLFDNELFKSARAPEKLLK